MFHFTRHHPMLTQPFIIISMGICFGCSEGAGTDGEGETENDNIGIAAGQPEDHSPATRFPGSGTAGAGEPLMPGVGPTTADDCGNAVIRSDSEVIDQSIECFYGEDAPELPAAAIEQIVEVIDDVEYVHLRLTLDPRFVDNSFGENSVGWEGSKKEAHTFKDLVGSDHAEMKMFDKDDTLVMHFKLDYISEDKEGVSPSGYSSLGVMGGDGKMIEGEEDWIIGHATSLDRNLNGCDLGQYTDNSPETDENFTPNPNAGAWDFRVVYEVWVDAAAFGDNGFGKAIIEHVHASPSKQKDNTIEVTPGPCPDCDPNEEECDPWDEPECDPNIEECSDYQEPCDPKIENCGEPCDPEDEDCIPIV